MKLVMTLLVRNEADILEANLRWHLAQGVDHFIITDNLSTDLTPEIISKWVTAGKASYIAERSDNYAQAKWVTRMARIAYSDYAADWIINNDADEFWYPTDGGTLKAFFARCRLYNQVVAHRHDFICVDGEDGPFWSRMRYRKRLSTNARGEPLPPKTAHRGNRSIEVAMGNHKVSGFAWPRRKGRGLEILHFPLRTRTQYLAKISLGGQALARNTELSKAVAYTWRDQAKELADSGQLAFLEENIWTPQRIAGALARGELLEDSRLADFMSKSLADTNG